MDRQPGQGFGGECCEAEGGVTPLQLRNSWILPGKPDPYGIDARLAARKQARLNGQTYVSGYTRRKVAA